jgi:surface antigen
MWGRLGILVAVLAATAPGVAQADSADVANAIDGTELAPYLQCVPYARERSGVQIFGDARTWWNQAAGRYKRGNTPRPGAVMTFRSTGSMVLGHVAAVSKVIDSRTVLLDHANWSPINGRRGQIERGVRAIDVSPANDWTQVRVWYAPLGDLGTTAWPVEGFIYGERDSGAPLGGSRVLASASYAPSASPNPSKAFSKAFAGFGEPQLAAAPSIRAAPTGIAQPRRMAQASPARPRDAIDAALARYAN